MVSIVCHKKPFIFSLKRLQTSNVSTLLSYHSRKGLILATIYKLRREAPTLFSLLRMIRLTGQQGHRQCTRRPPLLLTAPPPPPPPAAPPPSRQPHCCAAAVNMGILSYGIGDGVCDGGRGGRGCGSMSPLHITLPLSRLTADPCQDSQDLLHPDFIESTRNGEMVAAVSYFHKMNSILQMKMQDAF